MKLEKREVGDIVEFTLDHVDDTCDAWGICLVSYILGKFPGVKAIEDVCDSWGVPYKYFPHSSGWLVFKFDNENDRDNVLANGPYASFGRPWVMKKMPQFFRFDDGAFAKVPTWIKFPNLSMEIWTFDGLSMLASKVGEPIATDKITAAKTHPSYARVLVDVDATKPLVRSVKYKLPGGKVVEQ